MKLLLLLLTAICVPAASAQTSTLLETPARITAETGAGPKADTGSAATTIRLVVNQGTHEFRLTVLQRGDAAAALASQKARTGWKDGFLFIRDDCLDTNEITRGWRCAVDQVFTFVDSREGKRLVHLGDVFAGDDCLQEAKLACALYQGTFTDIYDALENNPLVSHAESPELLLEIHVDSGQFVVDLDATWGRNQERFTAGERCLAATEAVRAAFCVEGIAPRRAYLFNAALATYTRRVDHLMRTRAFARSALCAGNSEAECSDALRLSALMLAGIRPGEKPRSRGNVKSVLLSPVR